MIKKLIILVLVGALTLGTGCTKKEDSTGPLGDRAEENVEQDENGLEKDGTVIEETEELEEKQLEKVDLYPFLDESTGLYGYINSKGETIIEPQFEGAGDFSYTDGFAIVSDENYNMNYINEEGEYLLEGFKYENIGYPIACLMTFTDETYTFGVVDLKGNTILPQEYQSINVYMDGSMVICKDGKYGMTDGKGKFIVEPEYDQIFWSPSGIIIESKGKFGLLDKKGKKVLPLKFYDVALLNDDLIGFKDKSGKYAMYNYKGKKLSDHAYDYMNGYGRSIIEVSKDGTWGYLNEDGTVAVDIKYGQLDINVLDSQYVQVKIDEKYGIMDIKGEFLLEPKYDNIFPGINNDGTLNKQCFIVKEGNKRSLIDKTGKVLREDIYDGVLIYEDFIRGSNDEYNYIMLDLEGNDIAKYKCLQAGGEYMLIKDSEEEVLGYVVDYYTGQVISEDRYEDMTSYLEYNRLIARTGQIFYILDENCEVLTELIPNEYEIKIRDMVVYGEELIKVYDAFGGFHWINSKGERIK